MITSVSFLLLKLLLLLLLLRASVARRDALIRTVELR